MTTILYSGYYNSDKDTCPFEVDPNFFYLTSCDLPNITLIRYHKKDYVIVEIPDISNYDAEHFKSKLKFCFNSTIIELKDLIRLLHNCKIIHTLPNIESHPHFSKLRRFSLDMISIPSELSKKRQLKFIDEISAIKQACKYTSEGIKHIIEQSYPNMSQIELIGLFKQSISKHGIQELSFNPITAHNKYNQYLHYEARDRKIQQGSFVLLDLGCKYKHYCSDISRCFPISGKFTQKQKNLYNVVLKSFKYALKLMKPGAHWSEITHKVQLKLYDECLKINLVDSLMNDSDKVNVIDILMPHGLGHHVGLDNHDCGPITTLKIDMVVAVEPGIYFQIGKDKSPHINTSTWKQYEHLGGARIEDTILITPTGHKNLSKITKEIKGIEGLMNK